MTTRVERLDALQEAVTQWADRRIEELEAEAEFLRTVFDGRTSGGELSEYVLSEASALLEEEINAFLVE